MTGLDLDAIEARANAATPGPWATDPDSAWRRCHEAHEYVYATDPTDRAGVIALTGIKGEHVRSPRDAAFIAAARTDVPALVAEVRRFQPVTYPDGSQHYIHGCGNTEWWNKATSGPINDQGCDGCESAPDGGWRLLYVREADR